LQTARSQANDGSFSYNRFACPAEREQLFRSGKGTVMSDTEDPGFFSSHRVAVVGLGLMGGSLALALRGRCAALFGVDPDPNVLDLAREREVVDRAVSDPADVLPEADLVVLAAPIRAILGLIRRLPDLHPGSPVVMDLGSTKVQICQAMEALPPRFETIGGHPMCGKENTSLANADDDLYRGAVFALTPTARTTSRAREAAGRLAQAVGASPLWVDPETHDLWVAATSHLPYLVSSALAAATPGDAAPLIGPGYRSATRLAVTPTTMMLDVILTNRLNILEAIGSLQAHLSGLESALRDEDSAGLQSLLDGTAEHQKELLHQNFKRGGWS
jgi:prephenate dehydrogenase